MPVAHAHGFVVDPDGCGLEHGPLCRSRTHARREPGREQSSTRGAGVTHLSSSNRSTARRELAQIYTVIRGAPFCPLIRRSPTVTSRLLGYPPPYRSGPISPADQATQLPILTRVIPHLGIIGSSPHSSLASSLPRMPSSTRGPYYRRQRQARRSCPRRCCQPSSA